MDIIDNRILAAELDEIDKIPLPLTDKERKWALAFLMEEGSYSKHPRFDAIQKIYLDDCAMLAGIASDLG